MNAVEKILCHHAAGLAAPNVRAGDVLMVHPDWVLASELTWAGMDKFFCSIGRPPLPRPERFWLACDHTVDPRINEHEPKPRALIALAASFAAEAGLTEFHGPNETIMHTEFARRVAQPGTLVVGADSHTCSAGGMGALAIGLGAADVVMPLVTGATWIRVPEVVLIELQGAAPFGVGGKDVILHVLGSLKRNTAALDRVVYFAGPGLRQPHRDDELVQALVR